MKQSQFSNGSGSRLAMIQTCKKAVVRLKKLKMVTIDINLKIEYDEDCCMAATRMSVENEVDGNSLESSPTGCEIEECQQNQEVKCEENIHTENYQVIQSSSSSGVLTQSYLTKNELIDHCEQKWNVENTFEYDQCSASFGTKKNLDWYERKIHDSQQSKLKELFQCDKCERSYCRERDLHVHKELHAGNIFYCDECDYKLPTKRYLQNHKIRMHSGKRFKCDQCEKDFTTKSYLEKHKELHLEAIHDCHQCKLKFSTNRHLQNHKCRKHSGIRFKDGQCKKDFVKKHSLNVHKELHTGNIFNCDQCNRKFPTNRRLQNHKSYVHSVKQFKCDQCRRNFGTEQRLERHKRKIHDSRQNKLKKLLKCDKYERIYRKESSLREHKELHARNIFYCDECNQKFPTKRYLENHKIAVHSGNVWPMRKEFCQQALFKKHKELHLEAIHDCDQCSLKFSTNRRLQNHKSKMHDDERFKCDESENHLINKRRLNLLEIVNALKVAIKRRPIRKKINQEN